MKVPAQPISQRSWLSQAEVNRVTRKYEEAMNHTIPHTTAVTESGTFSQRVRWPVVVVAMLGGHVFLMMVAVIWGLTIPGAFVAPEGYEEGLAWDDRQAERQVSSALGWTLKVFPSVVTQILGDRQVKFELLDRQGKPIENATLNVRMYHHARADQTLQQQISQTSPGLYEASLRMRRPGMWHLHAVATRGADRFVIDEDFWIAPVEKRGEKNTDSENDSTQKVASLRDRQS